MNQIAMAIRKLNEGEKDLECLQLTSLELTTLHSIGGLTEMSPADLATQLQHEEDPTDWLIVIPNAPPSEK